MKSFQNKLIFGIMAFLFTANVACAGILSDALPEFSLVNQEGKTVTNKDVSGKIAVVNFIYTRCLDACPVMTNTIVSASRSTGADVLYIFISVDPKRDTPERLLNYGKDYNVDFSKTQFLTGTPEQIKALLKKFKVIAFDTGSKINHINITGVYDKSGQLKEEIGGMDFSRNELLKAIKSAR